MADNRFRVRDRRGNNRLWIDNAVLDQFGPELGPYGLAVYMALCRFADYDSQECWPSQQTIANRTGMGRQKVNEELGKLKKLHLIDVETDPGKGCTYWLLNVRSPQPVAGGDRGVSPGTTTPVAEGDTNKSHITRLMENKDSNQTEPTQTRPSYSERIAFEMERHIGPDLHDDEHTQSNLTRSLRLWERSGLSEDEFVARMLMARDLARKHSASIRKKAGMSGLKNRAPYFFAILEDLLDDLEKGPAPGRPDPRRQPAVV